MEWYEGSRRPRLTTNGCKENLLCYKYVSRNKNTRIDLLLLYESLGLQCVSRCLMISVLQDMKCKLVPYAMRAHCEIAPKLSC
jgi:hypothetical protein